MKTSALVRLGLVLLAGLLATAHAHAHAQTGAATSTGPQPAYWNI